MKCITTLIFLFFSILAHGQKQNNSWCFGNKAGMDFNSGSPVPFSSVINSPEGSATVSHRNTGALLFYTDGYRIWDKTHTIMPNGNGIGNDILSSSLQGAVIVPITADSNRYYVFSLEPESLNGTLFYSIVDMRLNGGMGDVVSSKKKIRLGEGFVEGMLAVATCDGHWLLLSSKTTNEFSAYRITASGIDTQAVVSQMPYPYVAHVLASIKVSPDNKKLLYATYTSKAIAGKTYGIATVHDFDEKTGRVSNGQLLVPPSTDAFYYSVEFSADGSKAYVCDISKELLQFDLSLPTMAAITASKKVVYQIMPGRVASLLQMGPDNNIYVAIDGRNFVDRISNTNAAYPGCVYTQGAVSLAAGTVSYKSFPPKVTYATLKSLDTAYTSTDVNICDGSSIQFDGLPGATAYLWQDNSTARDYTATQAGVYWVKSTFSCLLQTDSFKVKVSKLPVDIGADTTICIGQPLVVQVDIKNDTTSYIWQDGSTADSFIISNAGAYHVTVNSGPCISRDTILVELNDSAYFELGDDTIICAGDVYRLYIPEGTDTFKWSTGVKDTVIAVKQPGSYSLQVTRAGCSYADTIDIEYAESSFNIGNDTLVCNGEQVLLGDTSILNSTYAWSSGESNDSISVTKAGVYTLTIDNKCGIFKDSAVVNYKVCDCNPFIPTAFTPNNDGRNDKMGPVLNCKATSYEFIIINRFGEAVFKTTNLKDKWDGSYKGQSCDVGTYYYMVKIKNTSGTDEFHKGSVVLMR